MQQKPTYTPQDGWRYPTNYNQKRRHRSHDYSAVGTYLITFHLQEEPIPPRWKPEKSRFYACAQGTLLILAPWPEDMKTEGQYATFHKLNDFAAQLCALDSTQLSTCVVTIK